jgi:hypothetical protein
MIDKATYTKLTESRTFLRSFLQDIFIISSCYIIILIICLILSIIYNKNIRDSVLVFLLFICFLPIYGKMLYRKFKIMLYRKNG